MNKIIILLIVTILLLGVGYLVTNNYFTHTNTLPEYYYNQAGEVKSANLMEKNLEVNIASCLSNKDVILYSSMYCSHCEEQKALFEEDYSLLNVIEVSGENQLISDYYINQGLKGTPAWKINGEIYYGVQTPLELAKLSGCLN